MSIRARVSWYFLSSAVSAAISLITLPLTTRVLGPSDYGVLALGLTIAGVGAAFSTLGSSYIVANRWQVAAPEERAAVVRRLAANGAAISIAWAVAWGLLYVLAADRISFLDPIPGDGFAIALAGTVLGPYWLISVNILTIEGRAGRFAFVTIAGTVATAATTLIALFAFDLDTVSLFIGVFAGTLVSVAGSVSVLLPYLFGPAARGHIELGQRAFLLQAATEEGYGFAERMLLSRFAGIAELGLYVHSQRYRALLFDATKSVSRAVWPTTLTEARAVDGSFPATRRTWAVVHLGVAAVSAALVAIGPDVISLLTNDKFTDAWVYLAPWCIFVLVQVSANPDFGTTYAFARPQTLARLGQSANLSAIATLALLVPPFGAVGAVIAAGVRVLVFRIAVRFVARRARSVPFTDQWAVFGIALVLGVYLANLYLTDSFADRVALLVVAEAVCLTAGAKLLRESWHHLVAWRPTQG